MPENKETYILLYIAKPKGWTHKSGQYVQLRLPALGPQWHPFTIASCNEDEDIILIIKEAGRWTSRLRELLVAEAPGAVREGSMVSKELHCNIECILEGPLGAPASSALHALKANSAHQLYFVAGGVGITPFLSVFRDLLGRLKLTVPTLPFVGSKPVWWEHAHLSSVPDPNKASRKQSIAAKRAAWVKKQMLPSQDYAFTNHLLQQLSLRITHPRAKLHDALPPSQQIQNFSRNLPIIRAEAAYLPYTIKEKETVQLATQRGEVGIEDHSEAVKDLLLSPRGGMKKRLKKNADTQTATYTPPLLPLAQWRFLPRTHALRRGLRLPLPIPLAESHFPNIELVWVVRSWHQQQLAHPEVDLLVVASYQSQTNERFVDASNADGRSEDSLPSATTTPVTLKTPLYSSVTPRRASVVLREQRLLHEDLQYQVRFHCNTQQLSTQHSFSLKLDELCTITHTGEGSLGCLCGSENNYRLQSKLHSFSSNNSQCTCSDCLKHEATTDCMCPQCSPSITQPDITVKYPNTRSLPCACSRNDIDQQIQQKEVPTNLAHFLRASSRFSFKPVACVTCPALLELAQNPMSTLDLQYPAVGNNYCDSTEHVTALAHLATHIFPYIDPVSLLQQHGQCLLSADINSGRVDVFSTTTSPIPASTDSTWLLIFGRPAQTLIDQQLKSGMSTYTGNQMLNGAATVRSRQALQQLVKQIPDLHEHHDVVNNEPDSTADHDDDNIYNTDDMHTNSIPIKTNDTLIVTYEDNNHTVTRTVQMPPCKAEMYCCCPPALSAMVGDSIKGTKKNTDSREWTATLYKENF